MPCVDVLSGAGTVQKTSGSFSRTLNVGVNNGSGSFDGTITDAADLNFTMGLEKRGSGIQALDGSVSIRGATTVANGTLLVNGTKDANGTVAVNAGATLGGTGSVLSPTTINNSGTLAPGLVNTVGTLTMGDLTLATGSISRFEVSGLASHDKVVSGGTLTYQSGWVLNLVFSASQAFSGTIKLFDFDSSSYSGIGNAPQINIVGGKADNVTFDTSTGELTFENAGLGPTVFRFR